MPRYMIRYDSGKLEYSSDFDPIVINKVYKEHLGSPAEITRDSLDILYERQTGWSIDNLTERELTSLRRAFPHQLRLGIPGKPFHFH